MSKELISKEALLKELMELPGVGSNSTAIELIKKFESAEEEKTATPQFVLDYIAECKKSPFPYLADALRAPRSKDVHVRTWLNDEEHAKEHQELFAQAWLTEQEVEKEQLYFVKMPVAQWSKTSEKLVRDDMYLAYSEELGETKFMHVYTDPGKYELELTEAQIKAIDERYWAFAEKVLY